MGLYLLMIQTFGKKVINYFVQNKNLLEIKILR